MTIPRRLLATAVGLCLTAPLLGCGSDAPTEPSPVSRVTIEAATPSSSGPLVIPATYVYHDIGGVVLPKDSGVISVRGTLSSGRAAAFAQLSVYLLSSTPGIEYCGQNLPDSPTWRSLPAEWTASFSVTGFQVFRAPCTVSGIRVVFHGRDNPNLGSPPQPTDIIAEATLPVSFQISMQR